jgi:hypothetical protein
VLESAADRLALVRDAGEVVAIDGESVPGVFIAPYQLVQFGDHAMASAQPQVVVRDEDLPSGYSTQSVVTVRGVDYAIAESEPDGTGITTIRLRKRA